MSAWPQAVWIVKEIQNQFNLNQRVLYLENKYYIFAAQSPTLDDKGRKKPNLGPEYDNINFSDDSIWFVGSNEIDGNQITKRNVYAISLYHTENGEGYWSDFLNLSVDSNTLQFNPEHPEDPIWRNAQSFEDALEALAAAINSAQGAITSGTIALPAGVSENDPNWVATSNGYTCTIMTDTNYGANPTISLLNDNNINQKRNFEYIDYVTINGSNYNEYVFHAIVKPTVALSLIVSAY